MIGVDREWGWRRRGSRQSDGENGEMFRGLERRWRSISGGVWFWQSNGLQEQWVSNLLDFVGMSFRVFWDVDLIIDDNADTMMVAAPIEDGLNVCARTPVSLRIRDNLFWGRKG